MILLFGLMIQIMFELKINVQSKKLGGKKDIIKVENVFLDALKNLGYI